MFDSENMRVVNVRMNFIWKMSKLTYFPQKRLAKQKKIKQIDFFWVFEDIRIATWKRTKSVNSHTNIQILQNFRWKNLPLLYIKNRANSVWFTRYFETLSIISKCTMKSFPTWTSWLNLLHNKCLIQKTCV